MNEYQQLIIDALIDKKCEILMNCLSKRNSIKSAPDQIIEPFMAEFITVNAQIDAAMVWVKTQPFSETTD